MSLSTSHILSIGGERESLSNMCFEILQESALHLKHYPGAVSWLQTAVAKMEVGKQASNPEIQKSNSFALIFYSFALTLLSADASQESLKTSNG